jgi:hypothetical protein
MSYSNPNDKNIIKLQVSHGALKNIGRFMLLVLIVEVSLIIAFAITKTTDVGLAAIIVPLSSIFVVLIGATISDYRVKFGKNLEPAKKIGKYFVVAFIFLALFLLLIFGLMSVLDPLAVIPIMMVSIFGITGLIIFYVVRKERKENERLGIVKPPRVKEPMNLPKNAKILLIILLLVLVVLFIVAGGIIADWESSYP